MKREIIISVVILLLFSLVGYCFRHQILNQHGVLEVKSDNQVTVIVNGEQVGQAPVRKKLSPGQAMVQLLSAQDNQAPVWEGQVEINHGTISLVRRNFSDDWQDNWGETLTSSSIPAPQTGAFSVTSYPAQAVVVFDGETKGYTPLLLERTAPGQHNLELIKENYENVVLGVNISAGYQLNAAVKLPTGTESQETVVSPTPTAVAEQVVIRETPTGWLRVRSGAGTGFAEVARVEPGQKFPFLEENDGWLKIQLADETGWVSGRYAGRVQEKQEQEE